MEKYDPLLCHRIDLDHHNFSPTINNKTIKDIRFSHCNQASYFIDEDLDPNYSKYNFPIYICIVVMCYASEFTEYVTEYGRTTS